VQLPAMIRTTDFEARAPPSNAPSRIAHGEAPPHPVLPVDGLHNHLDAPVEEAIEALQSLAELPLAALQRRQFFSSHQAHYHC
jgi:hypothetical protein